ncbi:MBL fold metallo-hydrolase [bacterium]|nr:MBL fold metallo-hydrolase [bacterium]
MVKESNFRQMKLTVLSENVAGGRFKAEHGLSYLIEYDGICILFDTGGSDLFRNNAFLLNIDLDSRVDYVVLSHGHWDHGNGLEYIASKRLLTHPKAFMKRFRKLDHTNIGLKLSRDEINTKFDLHESSAPHLISDQIFFLGEIPRTLEFESQTTPFVDEYGVADFVPDDSALAIIKDQSLIVVTGCSHSGVCNIIEYAKKVTGVSKVKAVIGGFHLKFDNQQTQQTIQYLKEEGLEQIYPSHCTELPALAAFYSSFSIKQLKTGAELIF